MSVFNIKRFAFILLFSFFSISIFSMKNREVGFLTSVSSSATNLFSNTAIDFDKMDVHGKQGYANAIELEIESILHNVDKFIRIAKLKENRLLSLFDKGKLFCVALNEFILENQAYFSFENHRSVLKGVIDSKVYGDRVKRYLKARCLDTNQNMFHVFIREPLVGLFSVVFHNTLMLKNYVDPALLLQKDADSVAPADLYENILNDELQERFFIFCRDLRGRMERN